MAVSGPSWFDRAGLTIYVVEDCCGETSPDAHDAVLSRMGKEAIVKVESVTANKKKEVLEMKSKNFPTIVIIVLALAILVSMVFAAQDKYTVQVPNGLAF